MTIEAADLNRLLAVALAGQSTVGPAPASPGQALFRDLFKEALRNADNPLHGVTGAVVPDLRSSEPSEDALVGLARREAALRVLEAMQSAPPAMIRTPNPGDFAPQPAAAMPTAASTPLMTRPHPDGPGANGGETKPTGPPRGVTAHEATVIEREAGRTGVDPALLAALRRVENGGPGREFGVLSVPAPSLDDQARVAATSIRNASARFERQGGQAFDPATGRYTDAFLRFFSARYAPVGAANDPQGLNRHHTQNLQRLYARFRAAEDGTAQT